MSDKIEVVRDVPYAPAFGERGMGDLYLPAGAEDAPVALVIHGGGWRSMDKSRMAPVASLLAERGWVAYAVNYRLIGQAPWPACLEDCLSAARFLLRSGGAELPTRRRDKLLIAGASAGGHLALMTGLRLPREAVLGIVSVAGPTDLALLARHKAEKAFRPDFWRMFFGDGVAATAGAFAPASPIHSMTGAPPPLLCVHSENDQLVPISHSEILVEAWWRQGGRAEFARFDGRGASHGIWEDGEPLRLVAEVAAPLARFAESVRHGVGS